MVNSRFYCMRLYGFKNWFCRKIWQNNKTCNSFINWKLYYYSSVMNRLESAQFAMNYFVLKSFCTWDNIKHQCYKLITVDKSFHYQLQKSECSERKKRGPSQSYMGSKTNCCKSIHHIINRLIVVICSNPRTKKALLRKIFSNQTSCYKQFCIPTSVSHFMEIPCQKIMWSSRQQIQCKSNGRSSLIIKFEKKKCIVFLFIIFAGSKGNTAMVTQNNLMLDWSSNNGIMEKMNETIQNETNQNWMK